MNTVWKKFRLASIAITVSAMLSSVASAQLTLTINPEVALPGDNVTFSTAGGAPGGGAALFLTSVNGIPVLTALFLSSFDGNGDLTIPVVIPAGLGGLRLEFQTFGRLPGGGFGASNIDDLRLSELYACMGRASPANPGSVAILDDKTNFNGNTLGTPVNGGISGLAFTQDGRLWGSARDAGFQEANLIEIDPRTGALISSTPITDGNGRTLRISDLAVQPSTGRLYACGSLANFGDIFVIDPATAIATLLGNAGLGNDGGLAFHPDGTLYMVSASVTNPFLATLDPNTGVALTVVGLGPDTGLGGLAVHPGSGRLLGTRGQFAGGDLIVSIDPATGNTTRVGNTLVGTAVDLAFN